MKLLSVRLEDFRNVACASIAPSPGTTVVVGPNGQGKTNFLEALYALATLRPLRTSRFADLVRFGRPVAKVEGDFLIHGARRTIAFHVSREGRTAWVDGKKVQNLQDYFDGVSVVAFTPDDLGVVKGGPEGRRRFLDRAVFNRFPGHLDACRNYLRALRQRNLLVREGGGGSMMEAFDVALASTGALVMARRLDFIRELEARFKEGFEAIAPGDGGASMGYFPLGGATGLVDGEGRPSLDALRAAFLDALKERLPRDMERGFTSVGPHADDLSIRLGGRSARSFASQGQQRAIVLAFKVAELENLRDRLGAPPLLLLDDVSSELDPERNRYLMDYLSKASLQCVLTTTDERLVRPMAQGEDVAMLRVRGGEFTQDSPLRADRDADAPHPRKAEGADVGEGDDGSCPAGEAEAPETTADSAAAPCPAASSIQ